MAFHSPPELLLRQTITRSHVTAPSVCDCSNQRPTYRAAVVTELGKPLVVQQLHSKDRLEKGEVRVKIHCAGVNYGDILVTQGKYQNKAPVPFVPGTEASGEILEVGPGVSLLKPGDRVMTFLPSPHCSAFGEEVTINEKTVFKLPANVTYEKAAATVTSYATAWMALKHMADIKPGATVLVTAAAGGLGLAAVDLAANVYNAKVIGACGGPTKCELVKSKGAFEAIDYLKENVKDRVVEITHGQGVDIVLEMVGGKMFDDCLRCTAFEGHIVVLGFLSGTVPKFSTNRLLLRNCTVSGVWWGLYHRKNPAVLRKSADTVLGYLSEGRIDPHISAVYPLSQINEALTFVQSRKSTGKVVINTQAITSTDIGCKI